MYRKVSAVRTPVRSDAKTETKPTVQMGRLAQASKRLMTPRELRNLAFSGPGPKAAVVKEEPVRSDAKTETKPTVQMGRLAQASKRLMTPRELRNLAFSGPGPKAAVVKEEPVRSDAKTETKPTVQMGRLAQASKRLMTPRELRNLAFSGPGPKAAVVKEEPVRSDAKTETKPTVQMGRLAQASKRLMTPRELRNLAFSGPGPKAAVVKEEPVRSDAKTETKPTVQMGRLAQASKRLMTPRELRNLAFSGPGPKAAVVKEEPVRSDAKTETKPTVQMGRLAQASKRLMTPRELRNLAFSGPGPNAAVVKEEPVRSDAKTETKPTVQMGRLAQASKRLMTPRELRNLAFSGPGPKAAVVKEEPVRSDAKTETKPTVQMGRLAQASKRLMTPRELRNLAFSGPGPKAAVVKEEPVRSDAKTETKPTVQMGRLAQASKRLMTPRELRNLAFSGPGPKAAVVKEEPVRSDAKTETKPTVQMGRLAQASKRLMTPRELRNLAFSGPGPKAAVVKEEPVRSDAKTETKPTVQMGRLAQASKRLMTPRELRNLAFSGPGPKAAVVKEEPVRSDAKTETKPTVQMGRLAQASKRLMTPRELRNLAFSGPGPKAAVVKEEPVRSDAKTETKPTVQMGRLAQASKRLMTPRELRNLAFSGPGPKAAVVKEEPVVAPVEEEGDPMDDVVCRVCSSGSDEDRLLLCDACDGSFHTYCLIPPLAKIPKGNWRCPPCVTKEVRKPTEAYGFEQSPSKYSLHDFGVMADKFKRDFFGMDADMVPETLVEKEFWKQVVSPDAVAVKYGADLFSSEVGSGFPKEETKHLLSDAELGYVNAAWNLNNLPVLEESVLRHMAKDISGVMVPWCYVGMLFSTFCWHVEDHWSYSINYLHWGESKYWYGIAESEAEKFEGAMKELAPELFESTPDLLHHIVTMANPAALLEKGVKIHSLRQHAGEFVITMPRAYHAGFNQGYNFAEAVNFCPSDWLAKGRECIEHYRKVKRENVFCHDELVLGISAAARLLSIPMALATYKEMLLVLTRERDGREALEKLGVKRTERAMLEERRDEDRACSECRTTLFLSALSCACHPNGDRLFCLAPACVKAVCSKCEPSQLRLRYRYTLTELPEFVDGLKGRAEEFDTWKKRVEDALAPGEPRDTKPDLEELKELMTEWADASLPVCEPYRTLRTAVGHAEKCALVADQLISHKIRTRTRHQSIQSYAKKLKLEEVEAFAVQMDKLPCVIKQREAISEFVESVYGVKAEAVRLLAPECAEANATPEGLDTLKDLFQRALSLDLQIPEIFQLKEAVERCGWVVSAEGLLGGRRRRPPDHVVTRLPSDSDEDSDSEAEERGTVAVSRLKELLATGLSWPGDSGVESRLATLQEWLTAAEESERAAGAVMGGSGVGAAEAAAVLATLQPLPTLKLPLTQQLKDACRRTNRWINSLKALKSEGCTLDALEQLVNSAKSLPFDVNVELAEIREHLDTFPATLTAIRHLFQKPHYSTHTMAEILSPRQDLTQLLEGEFLPVALSSGRGEAEEWAGLGRFRGLADLPDAADRQAQQEWELLERLRAKPPSGCELCGPSVGLEGEFLPVALSSGRGEAKEWAGLGRFRGLADLPDAADRQAQQEWELLERLRAKPPSGCELCGPSVGLEGEFLPVALSSGRGEAKEWAGLGRFRGLADLPDAADRQAQQEWELLERLRAKPPSGCELCGPSVGLEGEFLPVALSSGRGEAKEWAGLGRFRGLADLPDAADRQAQQEWELLERLRAKPPSGCELCGPSVGLEGEFLPVALSSGRGEAKEWAGLGRFRGLADLPDAADRQAQQEWELLERLRAKPPSGCELCGPSVGLEGEFLPVALSSGRGEAKEWAGLGRFRGLADLPDAADRQAQQEWELLERLRAKPPSGCELCGPSVGLEGEFLPVALSSGRGEAKEWAGLGRFRGLADLPDAADRQAQQEWELLERLRAKPPSGCELCGPSVGLEGEFLPVALSSGRGEAKEWAGLGRFRGLADLPDAADRQAQQEWELLERLRAKPPSGCELCGPSVGLEGEFLPVALSSGRGEAKEWAGLGRFRGLADLPDAADRQAQQEWELLERLRAKPPSGCELCGPSVGLEGEFLPVALSSGRGEAKEWAGLGRFRGLADLPDAADRQAQQEWELLERLRAKPPSGCELCGPSVGLEGEFLPVALSSGRGEAKEWAGLGRFRGLADLPDAADRQAQQEWELLERLRAKPPSGCELCGPSVPLHSAV